MEGNGNNDMDILKLISQAKTNENVKLILNILDEIISDGINYDKEIVEAVTLLLDSDEMEIKWKTAQAIAELCKCEKKRISYAQSNIIKKILTFLSQPIDINNVELMKQSCRALGNICYDSYVGRDLVLNSSGIPIIVDLLPHTLTCDEELKVHCYSVRLYACKLLLILMLGGSEYIKPALDVEFLNKIHEVIRYEFRSDDGDDDRLHTALLIMSVVTEYVRSLVIDEELTILVVDILKTIKNIEISEVCLEYLHYQAEHDEVKTVLAKAAVPHILWALLEKHRALAVDEETRELMKLACDLIALILTGDVSMNLLYADGKGPFYLSMIESLSSDDIELSITAILAIGNFARTDTHCMHMMDTGVFSKLMSILLLHKSHEDDIRLQHVVLSGLRNLVIPQRNKPLAIEQGILPLLIEMVPNVTQYHVVFKLLATLRMLVDGQEAVAEDLVASTILDRVAKWGTQAEHAGVSGEASRLLARIIRQLQTRTSIVKMIEAKDCVGCLVMMLAATHAIMQNEAIVSLSILCVTCFSEDESSPLNEKIENSCENNALSDQNKCNEDDVKKDNSAKCTLIDELVKADLAKQLNIMIERNMSKVQPEIAENICKFLSFLTTHESLKQHLRSNDIQGYLKKLINENKSLEDSTKNSIDNLIIEISEMNGECAN